MLYRYVSVVSVRMSVLIGDIYICMVNMVFVAEVKGVFGLWRVIQ